MGIPRNIWFIKRHPIQMDDLGVPPFQETSILYVEEIIEISMAFHGKIGGECHQSSDLWDNLIAIFFADFVAVSFESTDVNRNSRPRSFFSKPSDSVRDRKRM